MKNPTTIKVTQGDEGSYIVEVHKRTSAYSNNEYIYGCESFSALLDQIARSLDMFHHVEITIKVKEK